MKKLQSRIELLHSEIYRRRIPVVLGFEGWDAAGKGGAIKRLTEPMDPRGYVVNPTAAPSDLEKSHHYLWRFWRNMPKAGHIIRTSTSQAPWIIVEGNQKYYARIKVLETVAEALEERLKKEKKESLC